MSAAAAENVDAGSFGQWLVAMRSVLRGERDADVPCGECVGCCISAYPIPLRPADATARAEVPEQWLIGAAEPDQPWLMGFREDGSCPFMQRGRCAIYTGRPQTCRDYDCRIYAAAGLDPDGDRPAISARVKAWRFRFESEQERGDVEAMRTAAGFIRTHQAHFPPAMRAGSATAAAVLAVKTFAVFRDGGGARAPEEIVPRVIDAARDFDR
jgi:hypothetical protein